MGAGRQVKLAQLAVYGGAVIAGVLLARAADRRMQNTAMRGNFGWHSTNGGGAYDLYPGYDGNPLPLDLGLAEEFMIQSGKQPQTEKPLIGLADEYRI